MFKQIVYCPYCSNSVVDNWKPYVTSSDVIDNKDNGMGEEIEHTIQCDEYQCPSCGKTFGVKGSIYEYPVGAYNYHELNTYKFN